MSTKDLKKQYVEDSKTCYDADIYGAVRMEDGYLASVPRGIIKTTFGLGVGAFGCSTPEDDKMASDYYDNFGYAEFIKENTANFEKQIAIFKKRLERKEEDWDEFWYPVMVYTYSHNDNHYDSVSFMKSTSYYQWSFEEFKANAQRSGDSLRYATRKEVENYLEGLEESYQSFIKRLNSYWKKYGRSKLNIMTWVSD